MLLFTLACFILKGCKSVKEPPLELSLPMTRAAASFALLVSQPDSRFRRAPVAQRYRRVYWYLKHSSLAVRPCLALSWMLLRADVEEDIASLAKPTALTQSTQGLKPVRAGARAHASSSSTGLDAAHP